MVATRFQESWQFVTTTIGMLSTLEDCYCYCYCLSQLLFYLNKPDSHVTSCANLMYHKVIANQFRVWIIFLSMCVATPGTQLLLQQLWSRVYSSPSPIFTQNKKTSPMVTHHHHLSLKISPSCVFSVAGASFCSRLRSHAGLGDVSPSNQLRHHHCHHLPS